MKEFDFVCVCGAKLTDKWMCPECSKKRDEHIQFCHLCGGIKKVNHTIGGPVSSICKKCENIVLRFMWARESQHDLWRYALGVEPMIKDEYNIGERIMEIEMFCAELRRVMRIMKSEHPDIKIEFEKGDD